MWKKPEALLRRAVRSTPILTRSALLGWILDVLDRAFGWPYPEFRSLPPNRYRVRVGVGNRLLFNQANFLEYSSDTWIDLFSEGFADNTSSVVDIGSGCGRSAHALKLSRVFKGAYTGIDVDAEMVAWCKANFPADRFTFIHADVYNKVYNPSGQRQRYALPIPPSSQDLVMSQSLFTHLLESDLEQYVRESFRVLRPGRHMVMSVFCLEHVSAYRDLGGRWSFRHRLGRAHLESRSHPEAAVAYDGSFFDEVCRQAGFAQVDVRPRPGQSLLICRKRPDA
jgi:SAM-dependent methyltransferase